MTDFKDDRDWINREPLGLFIHWGIFALGKWHEQELWRGGRTREDYQRRVKEFNPAHFDPEEWIDLAKEAGMTHLLFTTKHHDGFCLWDTKQTDYNVMNTPYGKDILAQIAEACAKKDFKLGLYYSLPDWHHPHCPNRGRHHELFDLPAGGKEDEKAYLDFVYAQLEELLTNYGPIWNFFWDVNVAGYKDPRFNDLIRKLHPRCLINDRGPSEGDYSTPERHVPDGGFDKLTIAVQSAGRESWGYRENEDYYTHRFIIDSIDKILSQGGRYILNVGPDDQGRFPRGDRETLKALGDWFGRVGEAFDGVYPATTLIEQPKAVGIVSYEDILLTRRENDVYVHVSPTAQTSGVMLYPLDREPKSAVLLNTGAKVDWKVDVTPWRWKGRPALRLYGLPMNELSRETLVVKLEF